jgi:hypothetical protein
MKPLVNVDVLMPKDMLEALSLFEAFCVGSNIQSVTIKDVSSFLINRYDNKLASQFKAEYLYQ